MDFDERYRSMTDDELLNVARDSQHLTPEARNSLNDELPRRRITSGEVKYENEQSNDSTDEKFNLESAYSPWPAIGRIRDTIGDWKHYRNGLPTKPLTYAWQLILFLAHLAVVYLLVNFCVPRLAGWTNAKLIPTLTQHPQSRSGYEFLFSHIFLLSAIPAFITGLVNAKFRHKAAEFVWIVPTVILLYQIVTFPSQSVLHSQFSAVLHEYFGGGFSIPEFRSWKEFWQLTAWNRDMARGMEQLKFTAPFYAGIIYSLSA
jgi:hypothetical protein